MPRQARANLRPMTTDGPSSNEIERRVLNFQRRAAPGAGRTGGSLSGPPPVEDLSKYEHTDEVDDYRHRMIMNVIAFIFVAALIASGVWLANTMAQMRKNQDCVLSGRRGCTPVDVRQNTW